METSDDLYRDLAKGEEYDLISASSDIAGDLVSAGLVIPLPKKLVEGLKLEDPLGNPDLEVTTEGDTYAVPFMWGPNVLIYNTEIFSKAPESWNILREYPGRVAVWDELSSLYLAALLDNPQANIYRLSDFTGACRWLPNFGDHYFKLWSDEPDLLAMFRTKQVVAAMGWPLATQQLRQFGLSISETIPKEKTTGWVDYLMIPKSGKHVDIAYKLIKYLSERDAQKRIARITHLHPANLDAPDELTDDERQTWTSDNIKFWRALGKDREIYKSVWEGWKRNECPPKTPNATVN
jgi:spermidine/putrescine-binding protein